MTTLALTEPTSAVGRALRGLAASISGFGQGLMAGLRAYQIYAELDGLSDDTLERRGLSRADLPGFAVKRAGLLRD